jgi:hypothetical protein
MVTTGSPDQDKACSASQCSLCCGLSVPLADAHLRNGHLRRVHESFDTVVARHGGGVDRGRQVIG